MLVKMTCEQCGGQMDFETDQEQMICPYCGNKIVSVAQKIQVEQHVTVEHKYERKSNQPTLVIRYKATDKSVKLVVRIVETNQKDVALSGQKLTYHLKPGKYNVVLKIGRINYNRVIYIPETYDTVNVNASWSGRAAISIDQPECDRERFEQEAREKAEELRKQQEEKEKGMNLFQKMFLKRMIPYWIAFGVILLFALGMFAISPAAGALLLLSAITISPMLKLILCEKVFVGEKAKYATFINACLIVITAIIATVALIIPGDSESPTASTEFETTAEVSEENTLSESEEQIATETESESPTFVQETSENLTTEVPITEVPTTVAPTTEAPTTVAPITEAPVTEAPAIVEQETEDNSQLVWKSATGTKYHCINPCGNMNPDKAIQMTENQAIAKGLTKCKDCWNE